ncbi:MAG: YjjG family noncanonical pyrimidine nucleotidase [Muribaculaceae bacterium]|nr:YjjG family noncanonical pyrimidine nucleotidase [Muribaculaceae bacterium]
MAINDTRFKRIPWIFFDLDDTIWNFSANSALALRRLYEISPILRKLFKSIDEFIDIYHEHNAKMWLLYSRGEVTTAQLKIERWRRTLATRQFEVLTAVCEELDRNYLDILARCEAKFENIDTLLQSLSRHALLAVLSNGFLTTQYNKLRYSGLDRYITRMIVSEEIGINKPDKRLFDYAIAETGATHPYIYIGDNGETDILGALKAGWHAIWVNPSGSRLPMTKEQMEENGIDPQLLLAEVNEIKDVESVIFKFLDF